jgi:hypothetical protein
MEIKKTLIFIIVICSCNFNVLAQHCVLDRAFIFVDDSVNIHTVNENVKLNISTLQFGISKRIFTTRGAIMQFTFYSEIDTALFYYDVSAFNEFYATIFNGTSSINTENVSALSEIIDTLSFSALILENPHSQFRFLFRGKHGDFAGDYETASISEEDAMSKIEWMANVFSSSVIFEPAKIICRLYKYPIYSFPANEFTNARGRVEYLGIFAHNFFRVTKNDTSTRLHYVFVPTEEERKLGMKTTVITSNWIPLSKPEE